MMSPDAGDYFLLISSIFFPQERLGARFRALFFSKKRVFYAPLKRRASACGLLGFRANSRYLRVRLRRPRGAALPPGKLR